MAKFNAPLQSKLPKVETTIFTKMSQLANETGALNLSQGFPDFQVDKKLIGYVSDAMKKGFNQYAPMQGAKQLREAIINKTKNIYNVNFDVNTEVTVCAGATQAIYTAITAFVKEGDEVIVFTPAYDCYEPAIELSGGKTIFCKLTAPNYSVDWDEVKRLVNRKTRMIIINTPHNPTGSVWSKQDISELEKITRDSEVIVLSDEVYEHIVFDGDQHESVLRNKGLIDRSLVVSSFGKTFHVTGWKMGYILGPAELMTEFRKVHQFNVFSCNHPAQIGLAKYIENEQNYLSLPKFYQTKRDEFLKAIDGSRFKILPSKGTYFQLLDYSEISNEPDTEMAIRLTKEHGIASIPVSVFYNTPSNDKVLRFCFAKQHVTLEKAGEIIKAI